MISLKNKAVFLCSRRVSTEEPEANLDLQIKEGEAIQTLRYRGRGRSLKKFISALRASVWSKNKGGGGGGGGVPRPLLWIPH